MVSHHVTFDGDAATPTILVDGDVTSRLGVGAAWLLDGMDENARLVSLEIHERCAALCARILQDDDRVTVLNADLEEWLVAYDGPAFDFAFVDTSVPKYERRDLVYRVLAPGAIIVFDDLLPNDVWCEMAPSRVDRFRREIFDDEVLVPVLLNWGSGLCIASYRPTR